MKSLLSFLLPSLLIFSFVFSLALPQMALAQGKVRGADLLDTAKQEAFPDQGEVNTSGSFRDALSSGVLISITKVIKAILQVVGVILLGVIMYGGIQWMTAGGNTGKVDEGRKWITNGAIGMVIIGMSYAIALFIENFSKL